jgi:hypothetical protein
MILKIPLILTFRFITLAAKLAAQTSSFDEVSRERARAKVIKSPTLGQKRKGRVRSLYTEQVVK